MDTAMDTITDTASDTARGTTVWTQHEPLAAADLGPDTVGYYADSRTVQDPAPLPVHAQARTLVSVTDFGADPSGATDSAKAINDALVYARGLGSPVTIMFPRGHYTVYPQDTPQRELYVSNTVGRLPEFRLKNVAVLIEDMHDVVVDGMGSELTFHGRLSQFAVIRSSDVTIGNFSTDWHAPLVLDLTVLASGIEGGFGFRDVKLPAGVGYELQGATATFHGETSPVTGKPYWIHGPELSSQWQNQVRDLASGLTLRSALPLWEGSRSVTDIGDNVLRVSYDSPADPGDAGKVYELRQRPRDTPGGFIWESQRVHLKNLNMHYLHGFGIVGQFSTDLSLDGIALRTKPGTWRQSASLADFIQLSGVGGKAQITNCLFDNPHDDPINIHGTYVQVEAVDRATRTVTLKYMEQDTAGFPQFYVGNTVRFLKRSTMLSDGAEDYKVVAVTGPSGRDHAQDLERMMVTVDKDLPANLAVRSYVAENMSYTPEVYIAGNTFKSVPTRGILVTTPKPVLIERNHFDQMGMASIYISADADYWYESGGITNAVIRNNVFDRPAASWATIWFDPTNTASEPGRSVHSNISIDANRFMLQPGGSVLKGTSVAALSFSNNHVGHYAPMEEAPAEGAAALFSFSASYGLSFTGNHYAPGFNVVAALSDMPVSAVKEADDGVITSLLDAPGVSAQSAQSAQPAQPATAAAEASSPASGSLLAPLAEPVWTGVEFGAPSSPLAWLTHAPAGSTRLSVILAAADHGTSLHITYNDRKIDPRHDGHYELVLESGPNVLQVRTLGADRRAGQNYRWVVIAA